LPFWSQDLGGVVWELQAVRIKARSGAKIRKAILEASEQKPKQ
jgi:hypothetical protein